MPARKSSRIVPRQILAAWEDINSWESIAAGATLLLYPQANAAYARGLREDGYTRMRMRLMTSRADCTLTSQLNVKHADASSTALGAWSPTIDLGGDLLQSLDSAWIDLADVASTAVYIYGQIINDAGSAAAVALYGYIVEVQ
jgi:hypothetical protein